MIKMPFRKRRMKTPRAKLKQTLTMIQNKEKLTIKGSFSKEYYGAKELWLYSRDEIEEKIKVAETDISTNFEFEVDLQILASKLQVEPEESKIYDCYMLVSAPVEMLSEKTILDNEHKAEYVQVGDQMYYEYPIRLGRFQETYMGQLDLYEHEEKQLLFTITKIGNISLFLNRIPGPLIKSQIEKVTNKSDNMLIDGQIFTKHSKILSGKGLVKGRQTKREFPVPSSFLFNEEMNVRKYGLNRYRYHIELDLSLLSTKDLADDIFDIYLELDLHDQPEPKLIRVGRPTTKTKLLTRQADVRNGDRMVIVRPYYTFKASNLSLETFNFPLDTYKYLKKEMGWKRFLNVFKKKKDVWLVGERVYKAQDTGYHFFKYLRENHPEKEAYYVIEKDSIEARNVEPLGNVLYFKSKEHIKKTLESTRVISSHHPDYLYPLRTKGFKRRVKADKVFLQHGVMGTKNMVANYGKNATSGFDTDLFLVSSDFERDMIITDFGYDEKEVFTTGLSRFDSLFKNDILVKRQLLIIPTWRDWINSDEAFLESEYFERYQELVNHPFLHELSRKHGFEIIFCLHPNMQNFTSYFMDAPVRVISQGEVDVQRLIKESAIMITD